jgi:hypothetical protein
VEGLGLGFAGEWAVRVVEYGVALVSVVGVDVVG